MSSISKIIQILTVGAGTNSAKAIFEIQTNDSTPKRILVSRNSINDPAVYFMNNAEMNAFGIFPTEVVAMYQNTWPTGLVPTLGQDGQLPDAYNAQFTQADFGVGKTGIVTFNGYNYQLGSFIGTTPAATAASTTPAPTDALPVAWYEKPLAKSVAYLGIATAFIVLAIVGIKSIFSKK